MGYRAGAIRSAGLTDLHRRGDRTFDIMNGDYRVIPGDIMARDLAGLLKGDQVDAALLVPV